MAFTKIKAIFTVTFFVSSEVFGCSSRSRDPRAKICEDFPDKSLDCKHSALGKRHSEDLALELYRNVANDELVDQKNILLVPLEIGRLIAALVHATEQNTAEQRLAMDQIRCYTVIAEKRLYETILADAETIDDYPDDEELDQSIPMPPNMLAIERQIFLDDTLTASENYTKESQCWFDLAIKNVNFKTSEAIQTINKWSEDAHKKELDAVSNLSLSDPAREVRQDLIRDPEVIAGEQAVVISSIFLKVAWKSELFSSKRTRPNEPFYIKLRGDSPHRNSETNVKIPMMVTTGKFRHLETKTFRSVLLPLDENVKDGWMFIAMPGPDSNLSLVEAEILSSGISTYTFMQDLKLAEPELLEVSLPRMTIQISHEWGSPGNKSLVDITNKTGIGLHGDSVGVYQDSFLELTENTDTISDRFEGISMKGENREVNVIYNITDNYSNDNEKSRPKLKFIADSPFIFIIRMERQVIAFGRVEDPYWCKFCKDKHAGGNHSVLDRKDNSDEDQGGFFHWLKNVFG